MDIRRGLKTFLVFLLVIILGACYQIDKLEEISRVEIGQQKVVAEFSIKMTNEERMLNRIDVESEPYLSNLLIREKDTSAANPIDDIGRRLADNSITVFQLLADVDAPEGAVVNIEIHNFEFLTEDGETVTDPKSLAYSIEVFKVASPFDLSALDDVQVNSDLTGLYIAERFITRERFYAIDENETMHNNEMVVMSIEQVGSELHIQECTQAVTDTSLSKKAIATLTTAGTTAEILPNELFRNQAPLQFSIEGTTLELPVYDYKPSSSTSVIMRRFRMHKVRDHGEFSFGQVSASDGYIDVHCASYSESVHENVQSGMLERYTDKSLVLSGEELELGRLDYVQSVGDNNALSLIVDYGNGNKYTAFDGAQFELNFQYLNLARIMGDFFIDGSADTTEIFFYSFPSLPIAN